MKAQIEVPQQVIEDTLTSGFEGGTNYWLQIRNDVTPMGRDYIKTLFNTGLMVEDQEGGKGKTFLIDKEAVDNGVRLMAKNQPSHFANMVEENGDAETGDVLLQFVVNGALLYG